MSGLKRSVPFHTVESPEPSVMDDVSDYHTHTLVKASTDVERDLDLMRDLIFALEVKRRSSEKISQQDADSWAHQLSGLACRVKNKAAD
jgi:hypothetical protein